MHVTGQFLLNNYQQALEILHDMPVHIDTLTSGCNVPNTKWLEDEHKYLHSKQSEPEHDVLGVEYVELLAKYNAAQFVESPFFLSFCCSLYLSCNSTGAFGRIPIN